MQHYNSHIDLRPSTILHAASASRCDTCWLAPWCENIHVPASLPCKKRAWITVLRKQWSSWINPPTHHTNLAVSIKLDFLIAGGICTALSPDSGITGVQLCKQQRRHTQLPAEKAQRSLKCCVCSALVRDTSQACRPQAKSTAQKSVGEKFASSWLVLTHKRTITGLMPLFHFFMILKNNLRRYFSADLGFF